MLIREHKITLRRTRVLGGFAELEHSPDVGLYSGRKLGGDGRLHRWLLIWTGSDERMQNIQSLVSNPISLW